MAGHELLWSLCRARLVISLLMAQCAVIAAKGRKQSCKQ